MGRPKASRGKEGQIPGLVPRTLRATLTWMVVAAASRRKEEVGAGAGAVVGAGARPPRACVSPMPAPPGWTGASQGGAGVVAPQIPQGGAWAGAVAVARVDTLAGTGAWAP